MPSHRVNKLQKSGKSSTTKSSSVIAEKQSKPGRTTASSSSFSSSSTVLQTSCSNVPSTSASTPAQQNAEPKRSSRKAAQAAAEALKSLPDNEVEKILEEQWERNRNCTRNVLARLANRTKWNHWKIKRWFAHKNSQVRQERRDEHGWFRTYAPDVEKVLEEEFEICQFAVKPLQRRIWDKTSLTDRKISHWFGIRRKWVTKEFEANRMELPHQMKAIRDAFIKNNYQLDSSEQLKLSVEIDLSIDALVKYVAYLKKKIVQDSGKKEDDKHDDVKAKDDENSQPKTSTGASTASSIDQAEPSSSTSEARTEKKQTKKHPSPEVVKVLKEFFKECQLPTNAMKFGLKKKTGMPFEQIGNWFSNERNKARTGPNTHKFLQISTLHNAYDKNPEMGEDEMYKLEGKIKMEFKEIQRYINALRNHDTERNGNDGGNGGNPSNRNRTSGNNKISTKRVGRPPKKRALENEEDNSGMEDKEESHASQRRKTRASKEESDDESEGEVNGVEDEEEDDNDKMEDAQEEQEEDEELLGDNEDEDYQEPSTRSGNSGNKRKHSGVDAQPKRKRALTQEAEDSFDGEVTGQMKYDIENDDNDEVEVAEEQEDMDGNDEEGSSTRTQSLRSAVQTENSEPSTSTERLEDDVPNGNRIEAQQKQEDERNYGYSGEDYEHEPMGRLEEREDEEEEMQDNNEDNERSSSTRSRSILDSEEMIYEDAKIMRGPKSDISNGEVLEDQQKKEGSSEFGGQDFEPVDGLDERENKGELENDYMDNERASSTRSRSIPALEKERKDSDVDAQYQNVGNTNGDHKDEDEHNATSIGGSMRALSDGHDGQEEEEGSNGIGGEDDGQGPSTSNQSSISSRILPQSTKLIIPKGATTNWKLWTVEQVVEWAGRFCKKSEAEKLRIDQIDGQCIDAFLENRNDYTGIEISVKTFSDMQRHLNKIKNAL